MAMGVNETKKERIFRYLNKYRNKFEDMGARQTIMKLVEYSSTIPNEKTMSHSTCQVYYYDWKREVLKINNPRNFLSFPEPIFSGYGENLIGKNGEYEVFSNEMVLKRNGAVFNFGTKKEMLGIFNEIMAAYEELGID